jgi:hypothetical protein
MVRIFLKEVPEVEVKNYIKVYLKNVSGKMI